MTHPLKILSFTAEGVLVPHTLSDIQSALRKSGHEVIVQDITSIKGYYEKLAAITDALVHHNPDIVFTVDQIGIFPEIMALLDTPQHVISWFFDNPLTPLKHGDFILLDPKLKLYLWDKAYIPDLSAMGFSNVRYRPFATNPEIFKPTPDTIGNRTFDVSFVGLASEKRMEMIRFLAEKNIKTDIFGDERWRALKHPNIVYHGVASNRRDCPVIFSNSKINLNITSEQLRTSAPLRIFDVLACGGFLLTDTREDIATLFKNNKELVIYNNPEDLVSKIEHYLELQDSRKQIGQNGQNRVLSTHTFDQVVPEILNDALVSPPHLESKPGNWKESQLFKSKQLVALSFLKFGIYDAAYSILTELHDTRPDDPGVILAIAALAGKIRKREMVEKCAMKLADLKSPLATTVKAILENPDEKSNCWPELYNTVFSNAKISLNPDGTIPGWM